MLFRYFGPKFFMKRTVSLSSLEPRASRKILSDLTTVTPLYKFLDVVILPQALSYQKSKWDAWSHLKYH